MQTLTEAVLQLDPPAGIFDNTVVSNIFPRHAAGARRALVHRAVAHDEVLRLKPGLHCLAPIYRRSHAHPFVVAAMLHFPSQVSLETALAHHGLIPEAVHQVASVTAQRSRDFDTPLGHFVFRCVPCDDLRAGVHATRVDDDAWSFVATPLRAIADLVYLRRGVTWQRDGLGFLTESMRIEPEDLAALSLEPLDAICASLHSKRTRRYLQGLERELTR